MSKSNPFVLLALVLISTGALGIIAFYAVFGGTSEPAPLGMLYTAARQPASPSPEQKSADAKRFAACRLKLEVARRSSVLVGLSIDGAVPRIVVGRAFEGLPLTSKQDFADAVNCFLMAGDDKHLMNFELLDYRTGKPVAEYRWGKVTVD